MFTMTYYGSQMVVGLAAKNLNLSVVAARAVSPANRFLPASRNYFDQL